MTATSLLTNVSLGTSDFLAGIMLVLVSLFLVTAVSAAYYYWKKMKRMQADEPSAPVQSA